ncbi:MAG: type II toxin-antitoxin system RatA family toxin [Hyphomicrobiaceae bacterium]|nr:type II toxin-antitoxin system RatA family toxin [Hyphomicrobiaceae bacterium]
MTQISFSRHVPFTPDQMLELVARVEDYPDFVPNCADMQVTRSPALAENECDARMQVQYGPISGSYTSRVTVDRDTMTISARSLDGPFAHLDSKWTFIPEGTGAKIQFDIDVSFSNRFLGSVAEPLFARKQEEIIDAFVKRASEIYRNG